MGSTRAALRAGIQHAIAAVAVSMSVVAANVGGSYTDTPTSCVPMTRTRTRLTAIPIAMPDTPKRPMTMGEKILARHTLGGASYVKPGDAVVVAVDGGYSHEFTTAQVHYFLEQEYGPDYTIKNPAKFAVFEDHLIYTDAVARMRPFMGKIEKLRDLQREFQRHSGVLSFAAQDGAAALRLAESCGLDLAEEFPEVLIANADQEPLFGILKRRALQEGGTASH